MHIPDGFLDAKTWISTAVLSGGTLSYGIAKTKQVLNERQVPKMGVMAAFIFAAQMINFPVAGGTSGHLIGGALAAITLGPWSASLIMATVLIIQCLFFQDGGLTALGANIFIMGIVAPFVGYSVYKIIVGNSQAKGRVFIGTFLAGWSSTFIASLVCTFLIVISNTVPLKVALPAMAGWHALIGIGEGIITAIVISYLSKVRADLVFNSTKV
ncbi:energy-coupling factor ABC transporter permease [Bacillota bacterium LX-D]|nr:energy-coupling factor ABC transporter permease [Bacillota bacterium LX-D]